MRNVPLSVISAALATAVIGCGDSFAPDQNNAGTGTSTLKVTADIDANDVVGGFVTDFDVTVEDGAGNPVSGATVTIKNSTLGTLTLLETSAGSGDYTATRNSFPNGDFELNVIRGTDKVEGVVLGGPGVHTITAPAANATVAALQELTVTWNSPSQAKSAEVETRDYGPIALPDNGEAIIPGAEMQARLDERIRVYRFNEVNMAGGLPGSRMKVEVRQTVEPVIVQ